MNHQTKKIYPADTYYEGEYYVESNVIFYGVNQSDSVELDKSKLRVTYEARIIRDTTSSVRQKDRIITLIGNNWYKTFSYIAWLTNMCAHAPSSVAHKYFQPSDYNIVVPDQTYRNLKARTIRNMVMLPKGAKGGLAVYTESQPSFKWELSDTVKNIEGYACQRAVTDYAGRRWTVWFTPEISVDCGFWKFSGLPGLILEASDKTGEYFFQVSSIENFEGPISLYRTSRKEISRKEFRVLEKDIYAHPKRYSSYPDVDVVISTATRTFSLKPDQLVYAYNPMVLK